MTNEQKQHLLAYLGYFDVEEATKAATAAFQKDYGLDPDGIFGPLTEAKIKEVVGNDLEPIPEDADWTQIKHFERSEFKCKCGKHCDGFPEEPKHKLLIAADRVREHFGKPAIVSSGVRCTQHNANVGGVSNSRHLSGKAMDFCVRGLPAATVLAYVQAQPEIRYAYAIDSNYVHMDIE